jgi:hypothetical protein
MRPALSGAVPAEPVCVQAPVVNDSDCLGLSDTCPTHATDVRMAWAEGRVLDKPQGRKPRGMPQWMDRRFGPMAI